MSSEKRLSQPRRGIGEPSLQVAKTELREQIAEVERRIPKARSLEIEQRDAVTGPDG
jgi:hypothetical protein